MFRLRDKLRPRSRHGLQTIVQGPAEPAIRGTSTFAIVISASSFDKCLLFLRQLLECLARTKVNKMKILQAVFKRDFDPDNYMHPAGQEPDSNFRRTLLQFKVTGSSYERLIDVGYVAILQERLSAREQHLVEELGYSELVIPGRVIHLQRQHKHKRKISGAASPPVSPPGSPNSSVTMGRPSRYFPNEAHINSFKELALSPSMGYEHLPDVYLRELEGICVHWGIQTKK
jgi:hypothetical protein